MSWRKEAFDPGSRSETADSLVWWIKFVGVWAIMVFAVFSLIFVSIPLRPLFPESVDVGVANLIVSSILTLVLIWVYKQIGEVQKEQVDELADQVDLQERVFEVHEQQAEIMECQKDLMSAEHSPKVRCRLVGSEGDYLVFQGENQGSGLAINMAIEVRISQIKQADERTNLEKDELARSRLEPAGDFDVESPGVLKPGRKKKLQAKFDLPDIFSEQDGSIPYSDAIAEFQDRGIDTVLLRLRCYHEDAGGESKCPLISEVLIETSRSPSIEETIDGIARPLQTTDT